MRLLIRGVVLNAAVVGMDCAKLKNVPNLLQLDVNLTK